MFDKLNPDTLNNASEAVRCALPLLCGLVPIVGYFIARRFLSKLEQGQADQLGGSDTDNTEGFTNEVSCNKGGHALRSIANQPNHLKFWGGNAPTGDSEDNRVI
jgi:hypothetical protein